MAMKGVPNDRVIDLNMGAKNRDEMIGHLAELLKNAGYTEDLEKHVGDVYVRESEGIAGIGGYVAIPHGKSGHVDHVGIVASRTRDMIDWESYDGEPSRLSFLFAIPTHSDGTKNHLCLITKLAGGLGDGNAVRGLQTAISHDDLLEAFLQRRRGVWQIRLLRPSRP